jgi:uncharacterized protein
MILSNQFFVEAPLDRVWALLDDLTTVIPCMPGAAYDGPEGEDHKVSLKVKIGAIGTHFRGTVRFLERNKSTNTVVAQGTAKDSGGKGSGTATVVAKLEEVSPQSTRVSVEVDLAMTGRVAQFGSGMMADISSRLISQFTANLHRAIIAAPSGAASMNASATVASEPKSSPIGVARAEEPAALQLGSVIAPVVARYTLRYLAAPAGLIFLGWLAGRYL